MSRNKHDYDERTAVLRVGRALRLAIWHGCSATAVDRVQGSGGEQRPRRTGSDARLNPMATLSARQARTFLAVAEHKSVTGAAKSINRSQTSVTKSIQDLDLERELGVDLFEHTPNAVSPTMLGRALVGQVKLARNCLHQACDELSSLEGAQRGRIRVGRLPFARTFILPRAIGQMRRGHPAIDISTVEEPYNDLAADLRCGDIETKRCVVHGSGLTGSIIHGPSTEFPWLGTPRRG